MTSGKHVLNQTPSRKLRIRGRAILTLVRTWGTARRPRPGWRGSRSAGPLGKAAARPALRPRSPVPGYAEQKCTLTYSKTHV